MSSTRKFDQYPPESPDENQLHAFFDNLKRGAFTTTKCRSCGALHWPPRTLCPKCTSTDLEWVELPSVGRVRVSTVATRERGAKPTCLAMVEVGGVLVPSTISDVDPYSVKEGMEVKLKVFTLDDGRVMYTFVPAKGVKVPVRV